MCCPTYAVSAGGEACFPVPPRLPWAGGELTAGDGSVSIDLQWSTVTFVSSGLGMSQNRGPQLL